MVREYKAPGIDYWYPEDESGEYVIIYPGRIKRWYKDGKRHRIDGPAIEAKYNIYYYEGQRFSKIHSNKEWKEFLKLKFLW